MAASLTLGGVAQRPHGRRRSIAGLAALAFLVVGLAGLGSLGAATAAQPARDDVIVVTGEPSTFDPARTGDAASAAVIGNLFESVTAIDPTLQVRPALASRWEVLEDGRLVVFHMRDGLTFADGTPLGAGEVVRSWLRLIDPAAPSPLASLVFDIEGAAERARGEIEADGVGLRAEGSRVEVRLVRPTPDFPAIVAGPTFGVVPPDSGAGTFTAGGLVSSGAYRLDSEAGREIVLEANDRYWAGRPSIGTVRLITDLAGKSAVAAFEAGDVDYTSVFSFDATWLRYDPGLGPQLRDVPSLSVEYFGFDTTKPPFDDVRVRQAFGAAVDWRRIVRLASPDDSVPATSVVPDGIPGRSDRDFLPAHDPDGARAKLAAAGYPSGRGFPEVALVTTGTDYDAAIRAEIRDVLGIELRYETMDFTPYFERLTGEPPAIWSLSWVADYPGQNDFLGVLLGSGQTNNYGGWRNDAFEAAIRDADYEAAQEIVAREVPIVPAAYARGWALSRDGLLGADQNGLGILRLAGLAWSD